MSRRRHFLSALVVFAASTVVVSLTGVPRAEATYNFTVSINTGGSIGTMWVDAIPGGSNPAAYEAGYTWHADGSIWRMQSPLNPPLDYSESTQATTLTVPGTPTVVRLELYPKPTNNYWTPYDPWSGNVGGVHAQRERAKDGASWLTFGTVPLPIVGVGDAFRIEGDVVSATPTPTGRVQIDLFQIDCQYPEVCPTTKRSTTGAWVGAFATGQNKNGKWTGSVGWPGRYIVFIRDTATNRHVHGFMDIASGNVPAIDLDAICFGLDICTYDSGTPAVPTGGFHPTNPTRILDTRINLGIANGPLRPGDGRSNSGYVTVRHDELLNHEFKVTGVAGIPESGVSAVLLNVTADTPPTQGFLSVYPKPTAVTDVFWDQATFRTPATSNLNLYPRETTPNLVLARVGPGGKIRLNFYSGGSMHIIADVAGWFDTGAPSTSPGGLGFTGIAPTRIYDTREESRDEYGIFEAGDDRVVAVAGIAGVPADATSVAVNITALPQGRGYVTAYPNGQPKPNASNLNLNPGHVRANMAVVRVGDDGSIRIAVEETDSEIIVDVFGYYGSGGGLTTTIDPVRIVDSRTGLGTPKRPMGQQEIRTVQVGGGAGVPSNATAVILNVTAVDTTTWGFLTVWPSNLERPYVSNLNWSAGRTVPNMVMVRLAPDGTISLFNELGTAHVIVDVFGYVT